MLLTHLLRGGKLKKSSASCVRSHMEDRAEPSLNPELTHCRISAFEPIIPSWAVLPEAECPPDICWASRQERR